MRIQIIVEPPLDKRHGMFRGRVLEVLARKPARRREKPGYWVMGDQGRQVLLMDDEVRIVGALAVA